MIIVNNIVFSLETVEDKTKYNKAGMNRYKRVVVRGVKTIRN